MRAFELIGGNFFKNIFSFFLADGIWEQLEPTGDRPPNLQEHTAVAFRDSIYVFGGEVGMIKHVYETYFYNIQYLYCRPTVPVL